MPETKQNYKEVRLLMVDDDDVSVMAIRRALRKLRLVNELRVARDGAEALEILRGEAGHEQLLPPYIVLLDINMPRMNGHEFLQAVRDDPQLHRAIIFVLTTSEAPEDIMKAYDKNIAGYVVKENPAETFMKTLELVEAVGKLIVLPDTN